MSAGQAESSHSRFLTRYLETRCSAQLLYRFSSTAKPPWSFYVDFVDLCDYDPELASWVLRSPSVALSEISHVTCLILNKLLGVRAPSPLLGSIVQSFPGSMQAGILPHDILPRLIHFISPVRTVKSLRSADIGRVLKIHGIVLRTSDKKVIESRKRYICRRCASECTVHAELALHYRIRSPAKCSSKKCISTLFQELVTDNLRDVQYARLRDTSECDRTVPLSVNIAMEDDYVGMLQPGDKVSLVCIPTIVWSAVYPDCSGTQDIVLKVIGMDFLRENLAEASGNPSNKNLYDFREASSSEEAMNASFEHLPSRISSHTFSCLVQRDEFVAKAFPGLAGLHIAKLAIIVSLSGNCPMREKVTQRTESHLLFVGESSTGKTELLSHSKELCTRGVLTTGIGSSMAGLTAAAVRVGGEWHLEAGALVLSDGGLCCIDDFHALSEADRMSLLEAMEQQRVSIAKAGIVTQLSTRCNVFAASTVNNVANVTWRSFSLPLLSRFDLVFTLRDLQHRSWDEYIAATTLQDLQRQENSNVAFPLLQIQNTIQSARCRALPSHMPEDIQEFLLRYYTRLKEYHEGATSNPITLRCFTSLVRLTQGHARLMHHSIRWVDAFTAVYLMEHTLYETCLFDSHNVFHSVSRTSLDYEEIFSMMHKKLFNKE